MVSELKIKDVTIDEVQNNYKIGYFGALFMRINMKKHFIQPEVSYNVSKGEIVFDKFRLATSCRRARLCLRTIRSSQH